ncbi:MAG: glycosyltransferase family 2 protein [bacterium]|jgi:cellulose synthase/poly-beta-1,6-N-acetylglucosamine synthase-like glycosyltransferase
MRVLVFWSSVALVVYTFALYPVILFILASASQSLRDLRFALTRRERRCRQTKGTMAVSILVCAHNEEAVIARRLKNCAELEYPADHVEILLGCDGCTDGTARTAAATGIAGLRIFEYPRAGKPETLNRMVPEARGDVLVFTDANSEFQADALEALVRHFEDPSVGCVCGELRLRAEAGSSRSEGLYWRYETLLKFLESRLNALLGANGAVFAIRRELYRPLPPGTIIDDFLIAMRVREQGRRLVYDPEAVAREDASGLRQEFRRRMRIGAGSVHALAHTWRMLSPTAGAVAFSYWSHKVLRWLAPVAMPLALVSALMLSQQPPYAIAVAAGLAIAGMASAGCLAGRHSRGAGVCSALFYFLMMNAAVLAGVAAYLCGRRYSVWSPTPRSAEGEMASAKAGR